METLLDSLSASVTTPDRAAKVFERVLQERSSRIIKAFSGATTLIGNRAMGLAAQRNCAIRIQVHVNSGKHPEEFAVVRF